MTQMLRLFFIFIAAVGLMGCGGGAGSADDESYKSNQVKKTGQTLSYDENGDEDSTVKDDGHYKSGVKPNYVRVEDKMVIDKITNLMWQDDDNIHQTPNWGNSKKYCDALELGGYDDWRLATITEMLSIMLDGKSKPSIDTEVFKKYKNGNYWTSTLRFNDGGGKVWYAGFDKGFASYIGKGCFRNFVRCVREIK